MNSQPLPDEVTVEDLGDNYLLVPYGVQFEKVNKTFPAAAIVYDGEQSELRGYTIKKDGEWSESITEELSEKPIILYDGPNSLYQSILGISGDDAEAATRVKQRIHSLIDIDPSRVSELQDILIPFEKGSEYVPFSECKNEEILREQVYKEGELIVYIDYCEDSGIINSIESVKGGKIQDTLQRKGVTTISEIEDILTPDMMDETEHPEIFTVTKASDSYSKIDLVSVAHWWESQKENPFSRPFMPREMNTTLLIEENYIFGVLIWSYLFGTYPIVHHLSTDNEISQTKLQTALKSAKENILRSNESESVYITHPYSVSESISDIFTPLSITAGSVKVEESVEKVLQN